MGETRMQRVEREARRFDDKYYRGPNAVANRAERRELLAADAAEADRLDSAPTIPTPEEIAAACEEIQANWPNRTRNTVREPEENDYEIPVVESGVRRRGGVGY